MNRKGSLLIEVLLGLFILGLIAVYFLPSLTYATTKFNYINEKKDLYAIGENIIEKLKSYDSSVQCEIYIFDKDISTIITELQTGISTLKSQENKKGISYEAIIEGEKLGSKLWKINLKISLSKRGREVSYEEYKAYLHIE